MLSPDQPGKRFLSVVCQTFDFNTPGGDNMKYSLARAILLSAIASSNAATLRDKIRLAQTRDFAECIYMQFGQFFLRAELRTIGILRCAVHR